ncbi:MAG: MqnA/MqnD/SBP family protein, partial [Thermoanaerobaculia bacterium]|nr:MqnA/MqnD/SBP family protein [Thermoanaerobaculia bacterium]
MNGDNLKITLAHSPDADDAFMFYALASNLIDTHGLEFEHHLKDIQSLNEEARSETYDVTALSFAVYPEVAGRYALLSSGASIGDGYGPIVVAANPMRADVLHAKKVAIPGADTSAFIALKLFAPDVETEVMDFDEVQHAVLDGRVDAGVIIHEGQLTFSDLGLHQVVDLGAWWKEETSLPLPLGCNSIRRSLGDELMTLISRILRESIQYSLDNREAALDYALGFGRGLDRERADRFVGMYVNELT